MAAGVARAVCLNECGPPPACDQDPQSAAAPAGRTARYPSDDDERTSVAAAADGRCTSRCGCVAERVSVGHGLQAARRASFIRTTFAATAPFSDDPSRLLSWANAALIERAGTSVEFVTAACVTYLPSKQLLRWAYAGHPPALWLDDGQELTALRQGTALGLGAELGCAEGSRRSTGGAGVLLYTDGLTEARHDGELFGLDRVSAALGGLHQASPTEAVGVLRARVADYAYGTLTDDLCLLAARIT